MMCHNCTCTMTSAEPCPLHFRRVLKTYPNIDIVEVIEPLPYDERHDVALQLRREREKARAPHHAHLLTRHIRSARKK